MKNNAALSIFLAILLGLYSLAPSSYILASPSAAHEGHDHAPAPGDEDAPAASGSVTLPDNAIKNLGVETATATLTKETEIFSLFGRLTFMHDKEVVLTPKSAGRVTELHVREGEEVKAGQSVVSVMPLTIGSSPVTLTSPINGVVVSHHVSVGQSVTPETTLYKLADISRVLVHGIAYEHPALLKIKAGQRVTATSALIPSKVFEGVVHHLGAGLDEETQAFNVYAVVDNSERQLLPHTQANMTIHFGRPRETLTIPSKAVLGEMGEFFVFVREGSSFERRAVTLGQKFGDRVEIVNGVLPDEQVVTVGNYQLQFVRN